MVDADGQKPHPEQDASLRRPDVFSGKQDVATSVDHEGCHARQPIPFTTQCLFSPMGRVTAGSALAGQYTSVKISSSPDVL